jgi:hypothetical protein
MAATIRDNAAHHRFELDADGGTATLLYHLSPGVMTLIHTEVPQALEGKGVGSALVGGVLDLVRTRGLKFVVKCPFVAAYMKRHPEHNDLLA